MNRHERRGMKVIAQRAENGPLRSCGECTACCTAMAVDDLQPPKPQGEPCIFLRTTTNGAPPCGCTIYADRPASCRAFNRMWKYASLHLNGLHEDDRPDRVGVVLGNVSRELGALMAFPTDRALFEREGMKVIERLVRGGNAVVIVWPEGDRRFLAPPGHPAISKAQAILSALAKTDHS